MSLKDISDWTGFVGTRQIHHKKSRVYTQDWDKYLLKPEDDHLLNNVHVSMVVIGSLVGVWKCIPVLA